MGRPPTVTERLSYEEALERVDQLSAANRSLALERNALEERLRRATVENREFRAALTRRGRKRDVESIALRAAEEPAPKITQQDDDAWQRIRDELAAHPLQTAREISQAIDIPLGTVTRVLTQREALIVRENRREGAHGRPPVAYRLREVQTR